MKSLSSLWIVCRRPAEMDCDGKYSYNEDHVVLNTREKMIFFSEEGAIQQAISMTRNMLSLIKFYGEPMMGSLYCASELSIEDSLVDDLLSICNEVTILYPPEDRDPLDTDYDERVYIVQNFPDIISSMERICVQRTDDFDPLANAFSENLYHRFIDITEIPISAIEKDEVALSRLQ